MNRILLIVDPQNDFISGTLAVPGAKYAMDALANYLISPVKDGEEPFSFVAVTLDTHPLEHCSFKENGGEWPQHCVFDPAQFDQCEGWLMYKLLLEILDDKDSAFTQYYLKGTDSIKEEYSIFENEYYGECLKNDLSKYEDCEVWVAGIAGDYCVLETLKGLIGVVDPKNIVVMTEMIASIDKGYALQEFIKTHKLRTYDFVD